MRSKQVRIEMDLYRRIARFAQSECLVTTSIPRAANWLIRRGLREVENQPEKENVTCPKKTH